MLNIIIFIILMMSIFILKLLFDKGIIRFNYPSQKQYVYGIDVSHHQKDIDWPQLKGSKAKFVYIKATEGATFQDPAFTTNWNGAKKAGLIPSAYHFFTLCRSGADQAENFLSVLSQVHGKHMPVAVDLEFGGNCAIRPTEEAFDAELTQFLNEIKSKTGCTPVLYVTQDFYAPYIMGKFDQYPLWIRDIYKKPKLKHARQWTFWQFANRGRLDGIETFVDLNVFKGSKQDFEAFVCKGTKVLS